MRPYRVAFWRKLVRLVLCGGLRGLFHILSPVKIIGRENIPFGKPYIAAINHVSLFDPPFILSCWPEMLESMGAVDIWDRPGQGILVRLYGGIPVHRGEYDRQLLDTVLNVLRSGYPLLIAPEGERSHAPGMQRAKPGVAFLADEARVPVIPVGIVGTTDDYWKKSSHGGRPLLEMRIGRPVILPPLSGKGDERRLSRQSNADLIMSTIAGLLPEEYRGVYADTVILPG